MEENEIKVGWYAFEGGKFSPDPNVYPNCQGVVAWLNPDPNAPIGQRGLILTPNAVKLELSEEYCKTRICDRTDGKSNTERLIAYGIEHGISFPAAEWCHSYSKNGVKSGEGFLPALNQLKRIVANRDIINSALEKIGGTRLAGFVWSSSEYNEDYAWEVEASNGYVSNSFKCGGSYVRCVLAF